MPTSTKFAQLPSSSIPRVLNRVPACFQLSQEISASIAVVGAPSVGRGQSDTWEFFRGES